jgi:Fur family ferric uptake transcriptional regulator
MLSEQARSTAESLARSTGDRVTGARVQVLAVLLDAGRALTHAELETLLGLARGINRVTLYRILEWLTRRGIAHKIAGADRVWRFTARHGPHASEHPHFVCNGCGRVLCLSGPDVLPKPRLPAGFRPHAFELTVKGLCDACGTPRRKAARGPRAKSPAGRPRA